MINTNCLTCKNYIDDLKCAAFPEGIPVEIIEDGEPHVEPIEGQDNEIVFELLKPEIR